MKSRVVFADDKVKKAYEDLKESKTEDKKLYEWIDRAFDDLEKDAFCGIQIPKKQIPKEYIKKYGIDNLWKYNLPNAWRLLYSVAKNEVVIISIIIEWMDHKNYERKFKYTKH
jgi:Txe/YoeB family toxin of Txe-Axe toxin-antitoxin module